MKENKGNLKALLPIAVFLVLYIGGGIALGSFYTLPTVFVFLVALMVAFLQNKKLSFDEKIHVIAQGLADDNIITMCLIFLLAGIFREIGYSKQETQDMLLGFNNGIIKNDNGIIVGEAKPVYELKKA